MFKGSTARVNANSCPGGYLRTIEAYVLGAFGVALLGGLPCRAVAFSCSVPSFAVHTDLPTAASSGSVAVGDFNGDGAMDLVTNASIVRGDGTGGFGLATNLETPLNYSGGGTPIFVATGDFNHDGNLDIASADYNGGKVWILLGHGDGTFEAATSYPTVGQPFFLAVGDFNSDGDADLVLANGTQVSVLPGHGDGTFGAPSVVLTKVSLGGVAVGDFNADGSPDLVVANASDNTVDVLLGNGDGTFAPPSAFAAGNGPVFVAAGDLDGDLKLDVAVADVGAGTVSVLSGDGHGGFGAPIPYTVGSQPTSVAMGDVNGDGKLDLVVSDPQASAVYVLLNDPMGGFKPAVSFPVGNMPIFVAVTDLNGDGSPDVVVSSLGSSALSVLFNACGNPVHDTVVLPVKPVAVTIPIGKTSVTKTIFVKVRNADQTHTTGYNVKLSVDDSDCGTLHATAAAPDFLPLTTGTQDSVLVPDGKTKSAKVVLTISASAFTSVNRKAPHRCTLWFTSAADTALVNADPTPANNSFPVELNVTNLNNLDQTVVHETTIDSLRPLAINVPNGKPSKTSTVLPRVGNADANEPLGDLIGATAVDGTCPTGTVSGIDFSTLSGIQSSATVKGKSKKSGRLAITATNTLCTPNSLSPQRCIVTVSAAGPSNDSDPDPSNNSTRLVIDMIDKSDILGTCVP